MERRETADTHVAAAFAAEELDGLRVAARVRLAACGAIALWTLIENRFPGAFYYFGLTLVFAVLGLVPLWLRRRGIVSAWPRYLHALLDVSLFTLAVLAPNPLDPGDLPPQMRLRFGNELYLFLFVLGSLYTYSPRIVLWTGIGAAVAWSAGTLWMYLLPDSLPPMTTAAAQASTPADVVRTFMDPRRIQLGMWGRLVVILLVFAGGLAVMVQRSRRLVLRQVAAERARANLARYFSPNLVDALAESDTPLRATRSQEVAVLFVDMVGFTQMAAHATPEAVIALLRDLHRRMVAAVFLHGGTVEKYLGDGLMVTFGTPHAAADDAARTLACVRAMRGAIAAWNTERAGAGAPPIRIGIGAHHGPVVVGDLGDERHLERAVVGDTVNVASRLQELARSLDADVVVSDALVRRARAAGDAATDLVAYGAVELRGREERISVAVFASPA
jgi:adenylate cyclase